MAEIINLRRARKGKARTQKTAEADANRTKHGISKSVRDLARARTEKETRAVDAGKLDKEE